jgi:LPPG:FO 2-phospho-L-lactate transferase
VLAALEAADLIVICPSNPWVSIGPILAIPGVRQTLIPYPSSSHVRRRGRRKEKKIVVAISPIIRGKTVRGPAAKMYAELGIRPSALAVAEHYQGLLTGFAFDQLDADLAASFQQSHIRSFMTDTLMKTRLDRRRLAEEILKFAETLA